MSGRGLAAQRFYHEDAQRALTCFGGFDPSGLCKRDRETLNKAATAL